MENQNYKKHFGLDSIKRSLKHFLIGKGINVVLSLAILFTLARSMTEADYASFVSWQAIIMIVALVASPGIQSVLQRFLPELRSQSNNVLVYRLLTIGVSLRYVLALLLVCLLIYFLPKVGSTLSTPDTNHLLTWFLLIGSIRVTSLTISQAFDSLLWQRISQLSLVCSNLFRIISLVLVHYNSTVTLQAVVLIELGAEVVFVLMLLGGYFKIWRNDEDRNDGDKAWWQQNQTRVVRYGASRYLANLSKVMYGGGPNRLLVAQYMPIREVAVFGFADSILSLARRFAPVVLMLGFIRPVFVAKYTSTGDFSFLVRMSDIIYRVNMALLILLVAGLFVLGGPVLDILTNSKYGEAGILLVGFFILLTIEGFRLILELLIEVTELNRISISSNIVQSLSLFLAIPLFSVYGLWAIVIANIIGTIAASANCVYQLNRNGYRVNFSLSMTLLIILNGILASAIGYWVHLYFGSILLTGATIGVVYLASTAVFRPLNKQEFNQLMKFVSKGKKSKKS